MRRFVVHTLDHARAALRAAAETGLAVTLESPPGAVHSLGIGYVLAMLRAARRQIPNAASQDVLDCGEAPGLALAALKAGARAIRLNASPDVLAKVADIAGQQGASLEPPPSGPSLDLKDSRDPLAAARAFLADPS